MEKLKVGVFGLFRGMEYVRQFSEREDTEIYAVCDKDPSRVEDALKVAPNAKAFSNFEEFIESGVQAIYLANYFHEHAKYAIIAMEKGVDVLSECTSAPTMKDCVALWECVERTGRKYMLAENEPYAKQNLELAAKYKDGTLGKFLYGEGEYNHYTDKETRKYHDKLAPDELHWRRFLPRTYYLTHSLGPLMLMTGEWPVNVNAMAVTSPSDTGRPVKDCIGMMMCKTNKGGLYRFSGCTTMVGGYGFRVVGDKGLVETGRGLGEQVSLIYKDYEIPEGRYEKQIYTPEWPESNEQPSESAHGGADWWIAKGFADYVLRDEYPFFDYKCGIVMSMVAILGWRSILEGGKTFDIPDFTRKEVRDLYREDDASPFPDENGNCKIPCTSEPDVKYENGALKACYL